MPLFVFHHGAGFSKESFLLLEREIHARLDCETLSFDCRGHGQNGVSDSDLDLSLETLATDMEAVIIGSKKALKDVVLVGHSMGGAVVVEVANRRKIPGIIGVVVLDVVEGSAIDALIHMKSILAARPPRFKTIDDAVDYMVDSRQLRNRESALLSVPSSLKLVNGYYEWKVDLLKSEKYWIGWFENLSCKFLQVRGAKLLVLAGTDRLDKQLLIGQMQGILSNLIGKFQLEIIPESGHCINEDVPSALALILVNFWQRNQPLDISKIKKVGM